MSTVKMYRAVLRKSVTMPVISRGRHISCVTSDRVWISDSDGHLILTNTTANKLYHLIDIASGAGVHTVNNDGDLIYIDSVYNINKLSTENKVKITLIKYNTSPWRPRCVYSSPSTGDLLVGMYNTDTDTAKVNRYNKSGHYIQAIQHNNITGQDLYSMPSYITENRNGDIIVSDWSGRAVVVTDRGGSYRLSYTGPPTGSGLAPLGICTDALSHILVCDLNTQSIQIIYCDGHFRSQIQTRPHGIDIPWGLSYVENTNTLWVGSYRGNTVNLYRMLVHNDYLTSLPLEDFKCKKHPSDPLSKYCIPCDVTLCKMCIWTTSSDHKKHDVRDVEKLFREIHKRKGL
ncbi:uncharacterized protein LOC134275237 [Saccostrea cucullata]|uniref:uncharacterized protein LOC134275237 n=1 Tax=Saccostrea cuccullata TaxID=36930 RepID=UPI002ED19590